MYLALALAAAVSWGASDFVGGFVGRRAPGTTVAFASQAIGLAALLLAAPLTGGSATGADLAWGGAAGLGGAAGVALLYHGLAIGQMSVVAPVTAVGSATLPVVFGLLTGERPSPPALAGVVLALLAVTVLCSFGSGGEAGGPRGEGDASGYAAPPAPTAGLAAGIAAGVGFGVFFICIGRTGDGAGLWPLLGARAVSVATLGTVVVLTRRALLPGGGTGGAVLLTGVLDAVANVAYLLASRRGLLSIVALLASLYPAATVALARVVLGERLTGAQVAGLVGAVAAVGLIAAG